MQDIETQLSILQKNLDQEYKLFISFWIIFMQCGFALLEAGSVRSKNATNILFKNVLDLFVGALSYWIFGYAFAFGSPANAFIGHNNYFSTFIDLPDKNDIENGYKNSSLLSPNSLDFTPATEYYSSWTFQFAFAATASTIVSGAMAERTQFAAYLIYSFIITGFIYPIISHWCWDEYGWLFTGAGLGLRFLDFAGSCVVHVTGGTAAFVGAKLLGPRIGRFHNEISLTDVPQSDTRIRGHSVPLACTGGFILFCAFLAFNGGSQQSISKNGDGLAMSLSVVNTVLAGSTASLSSMVFNIMIHHFTGKNSYWSLLIALNGGLAGMVSVCAGSNDIYPWTSVLFGAISGCGMVMCDSLLLKYQIDDPIGAVAVHFVGGVTGAILIPIFAINGQRVDGIYVGGVIYGGHPMAFASFGWNLLGTICIIFWTGTNCFVMFYTLKLVGLLRVTEQEELLGLDIEKHGEPAYPETSLANEATGPIPYDI